MPASPSAPPEMRDSPARVASLRQWLERIVATLPEPRQRMYDLFVTRGLDSRNAALELGTTVAEVRRLRRENRQAILRAFEVTALAAAEAAVDPSGIGAPGCAGDAQTWPMLAATMAIRMRTVGATRRCCPLPCG